MLKVVYDQTVSGVGLGNVLEQRPTLDGKTAYTRLVRYDYATLADVWAQMLLADPASQARSGYRHDLAQVARQVLVNLCDPVLQKALQAFKAGDARELERWSSLFLEIGRDVERIQGAFPQYSMDRWLQEAGSFAAPDAPASYFQTNAKVLVTTWGPRGCLITDYAARDFGGLVRDYYLPRWSLFFEALKGSLERKEAFDAKAFAEKAKDFEWAYTQAPVRGSVSADPAPAPRDLYRKYVAYFPLLAAPVAK
jgi:alpha-N-acetylglucosaminidase